MAKITIAVGEGEDDFAVMRDGERFSLREGESIVLLSDDGMTVLDSGAEPVTTMMFVFPADLEGDEGEGDEPDAPVGVQGAPAGASAAPIVVPANDRDGGEPDMRLAA